MDLINKKNCRIRYQKFSEKLSFTGKSLNLTEFFVLLE